MTCTPDHIAQQIREGGFRLTPQRMAIVTALHTSGGHLSPIEIYEQVRGSVPGLTEPTVYRTLEVLCETGLVRATHPGGGRLEYELAGEAHHHLICCACGQAEEIPHKQIQFIYDQLEKVTGYRLTESHITFSGLCPHCKGE
jgi:Fe2+ or Zn2+ uptake regulation protein